MLRLVLYDHSMPPLTSAKPSNLFCMLVLSLETCNYQPRSQSVTAKMANPQTLRVQVPNNWVLGIWVIVVIVQVWGKYMINGYLDP